MSKDLEKALDAVEFFGQEVDAEGKPAKQKIDDAGAATGLDDATVRAIYEAMQEQEATLKDNAP